jgi:hypothetical protein
MVWSSDDIPKWCDDVNGEQSRFNPFLPKLNLVSLTAGGRLPQLRRLCALKADLSGLEGSLKRLDGPAGTYYRVDFKVVVKFGGTQLQATIQWEEGVRMRIKMDMKYHSSQFTQEALCEGPVTIIPNAII